MVADRLAAARHLASDNNASVATWAGEVIQFLEDWQRRAERDDREEWIWDYRIGRDDFQRMIRAEDSPQRFWAIGRLLQDAPPERVRELLSPEDIALALPKLTDLDDATRRKWSAYARHVLEH
jgi:hypothetical protein